MDEYKKDDRGRSKAKRLTETDPHTKVDSSTWTPSAPENAGVKTGARPISKRLYKKGGKVIGKDALKRADRKPRKAGGRAENDRAHRYLTPDNLINRDVRMANDEREGVKHIGAFKKGGKAKKRADGGATHQTYETTSKGPYNEAPKGKYVIPDMPKPKAKGGRTHKLGGGMVGDNPISVENRSMAKATGMMKKGGRAKHATKGAVERLQDFFGTEPKTAPQAYPNVPAQGGNTEAQRVGAARQAASDTSGKASNAQLQWWNPLSSTDTRDVINAEMNAAKARQNLSTANDQAGYKKGGKIKHTDEAQDKKLMHKVLKPKAFKSNGGPADDPWANTIVDSSGRNTMPSTSSWAEKKAKPVLLGSGQKMTPDDPWYNFQPSVNGNKRGGKVMHHDDCTCKMCGGGRTMKYSGGGVFSGNSKEKIPGATGGRKARASGGGFGEAFKAGRAAMLAGGPKTFEYNGKMYTTDLAAPATKSAPPSRSAGKDMMPASGPQEKIVGTPIGGRYDPTQSITQPSARTQNYSLPFVHMGGAGEPAIVFGSSKADQDYNLAGNADLNQGFNGPSVDEMRQSDARGGRTPHKAGGRTKAGKTTINIVMGGHGQQPQNMPNAPVQAPKPPMGAPVPPPQMAGGAPMGAGAPPMPPQMPPQMPGRATGGRTGKMVGGSLGNAQGFGQPSMGGYGQVQQPMMGGVGQQGMMPRKSGGRTNYPIDTGAGGANARLEKIDAYGLKPSKRK